MLADAFGKLSPRLATHYTALLARELAESPELASLHDVYTEYAKRDRDLPRPVLAYFGYHAFAEAVDFTDVDHIGEGLLIPQLLRDVLAIHDDIVDEELDKFGAPPLPVTLSSTVGRLTQHGKDLALYYGDFLVGVLFRVAAHVPGEAGRVLVRLIADTLYVSQRGQIAELLAEEKPLTDVTIGDLLLIGERKAAHYCYSFPFVVGATLAGHAIADIEPAVRLLLKIGTASQVVDDITGIFPGVIDHDKDTLGEIANLRRTVPLVLLATGTHRAETTTLLTSATPLSTQTPRSSATSYGTATCQPVRSRCRVTRLTRSTLTLTSWHSGKRLCPTCASSSSTALPAVWPGLNRPSTQRDWGRPIATPAGQTRVHPVTDQCGTPLPAPPGRSLVRGRDVWVRSLCPRA